MSVICLERCDWHCQRSPKARRYGEAASGNFGTSRCCCLLAAAVAGGAGAVYFGLRHFNARGRADNFKRAELAGHVAYCHAHG